MELMHEQDGWTGEADARVDVAVLARVFLWTGLGLGLSLVTAAIVGWSGVAFALFPSGAGTVVLLTPVGLLLALVLSLKWLPLGALKALFVLFAVTSGGALSLVLFLAPPSTLAVALGPASIGFVGAGLVALLAERELGRLQLVGAMIGIGLVAAAAIGLAGESSLLPYVGVLAGALLASFDLLWSKRIDELVGDVDDVDRLVVCGAVCLFLDLVALILWLAYLFASALAQDVSDA